MAQKDSRGVAQDEHQSFIEWCIRTAVFVVFYGKPFISRSYSHV